MRIWLLCGEVDDGVDTIESGEELVLQERQTSSEEWVSGLLLPAEKEVNQP